MHWNTKYKHKNYKGQRYVGFSDDQVIMTQDLADLYMYMTRKLVEE